MYLSLKFSNKKSNKNLKNLINFHSKDTITLYQITHSLHLFQNQNQKHPKQLSFFIKIEQNFLS